MVEGGRQGREGVTPNKHVLGFTGLPDIFVLVGKLWGRLGGLYYCGSLYQKQEGIRVLCAEMLLYIFVVEHLMLTRWFVLPARNDGIMFSRAELLNVFCSC